MKRSAVVFCVSGMVMMSQAVGADKVHATQFDKDQKASKDMQKTQQELKLFNEREYQVFCAAQKLKETVLQSLENRFKNKNDSVRVGYPVSSVNPFYGKTKQGLLVEAADLPCQLYTPWGQLWIYEGGLRPAYWHENSKEEYYKDIAAAKIKLAPMKGFSKNAVLYVVDEVDDVVLPEPSLESIWENHKVAKELVTKWKAMEVVYTAKFTPDKSHPVYWMYNFE